jgi:hypothetical protein
MKPFQASSSSVEVNGETVLSIVAGMAFATNRAQRILAAHKIDDPKPGHWYRQQDWLDAFKEIADILGPNTLYQIGMKIPEQAKFPPTIDSVEKALSAINQAYQMNHRGGEIGSYEFHPTGAGTGKVVCRNPYPSDFDRGIIHAMASRFAPNRMHVKVELDSSQPTRKTGGDTCTFLVAW